MAVSHQWYIQWSEPSALFNDITNKHNNINNWNNLEHVSSEFGEYRDEDKYDVFNNKRERNQFNSFTDSDKLNYGELKAFHYFLSYVTLINEKVLKTLWNY